MKKINLADWQVWPAFVRLKNDELFSSWLIRIAHNHRMDYRSFYRVALPGLLFIGKDIDLRINDIILKKLSITTCTKLSKIKRSIFLEETDSFLIIPYSYFETLSVRRGIMFCPKCLDRDENAPYFRKEWRLATSFYCSIHHCLLMDRCPKCKAPVMPWKVKLKNFTENINLAIGSCYNCSFLLKQSNTKRKKFLSNIKQLQSDINGTFTSADSGKNLFAVIELLRDKRKDYAIFKQLILKHLELNTHVSNRPLNKLSVCDRYVYLEAAMWVCKNILGLSPGF